MVTKLLDEVCDKNGTCHFLNKTRYLQIIISVEVLVALVFLLIYLGMYGVICRMYSKCCDLHHTDISVNLQNE